MTKILIVVAMVEVVQVMYMIYKMFFLFITALEDRYNKVLDRCAEDIVYRNNIASTIFFFQDMGPNISSFSVIALIISSEEKYTALTAVFFAGIMMKEMSRKLKNKFYSEIDARSS